MTWDYPEVNPFAGAAGDFTESAKSVAKGLENLQMLVSAFVQQKDATKIEPRKNCVFSTDPPYYDNIACADLSDFFYVWLRKSLKNFYPEIFGILVVTKEPELVAAPYRFNGDKKKAKQFFEQGLHQIFRRMRETQNLDFPVTVYYAFKQSEDESDNEKNSQIVTASTEWSHCVKLYCHSCKSRRHSLPYCLR